MPMVPNRIYASEMEYTPMKPALDGKTLEEVTPYTFHETVINDLRQTNVAYIGEGTNKYLGSGARLYCDMGKKQEFATPEDDTIEGAVANEIAGENIIQSAADRYSKVNKAAVFVTKRVVDDELNTSGYHANYSTSPRIHLNQQTLALYGVFAASRSVLLGAGALLPYGTYAIAQKALDLKDDFNNETVRNKPVVNLRQESHSDSYKRLHDTSGDPLMSPWAMRMKHGSASLVVRLIENGRTLNDLRFADPLWKVARTVARDPHMTQIFKLENGRGISALGVMKRLAHEAQKLEKQSLLSDDESWALEELNAVTRDMGTDIRKVADRVEWVLKLEWLKQLHDKHGWTWTGRELRSKDRQFSDLSERGIGQKLRQGERWGKWMPSDQFIDRRRYEAPSTTRAHLRGAFVRAFHANWDAECKVDWTFVTHNGRKLPMGDPFKNQDGSISEIIAKELQRQQDVILQQS